MTAGAISGRNGAGKPLFSPFFGAIVSEYKGLSWSDPDYISTMVLKPPQNMRLPSNGMLSGA